MIRVPRVLPPPKVLRLSVRDWLKGYNSQLDEGRTPNEGLRQATNVILDQDGTVRPRQSLAAYGDDLLGPIIGELFEFVDENGGSPENWLCSMQVIAGVGRICIAKDGGTWTALTGKTYDDEALAHFSQIEDKILVTNGVDTFSYVDIPSSTIIPYVALTTPIAPTLGVGANIVGTTYPVRYRITATNAGETAGSTAGTGTVLKPRESWVGTTGGATEYVDVTITRVTNAQRYNIYYGDIPGSEVFIASVPDPGSGTTFVFRDLGVDPRDVTREVPLDDTTAGAICTRSAVINGQVFLVGDTTNPSFVRFGGYGDAVLDFSNYGGGGFSVIGGKGSKSRPVGVIGFRNPQGGSTITVICNGEGKRFTMTPDTLTVGDTTINYFKVEEVNGSDGTNSPDGVVQTNDSLWYPSTGGFKTTGTKPQLQNVLSTDIVSETIENDFVNLNVLSMDKCVGIEHQGRIYWALPVGSTNNNQIWTLDLVRKGAWMLPMTIAANWMTIYTDNSGVERFLISNDDGVFEFTSSMSTTDGAVGFDTAIASGFLKFSEDGLEWARVIDVTFILLRPQGQINLSVSGKTEDASLATLAAQSFNPNVSVAGWGEYGWSDGGWSLTEEVPTTYGNAREQIVVEIDEDLNWVTWNLNTYGKGISYQLSDCIIRYVPIGVIDTT